MRSNACIPVIPSADLNASLRFWVDGLGFSISSQMHDGDRLINCLLENEGVWIMLNQRAGTTVTPHDYEGIRLYWAPRDIREIRERLKSLGYAVSELDERDYGQTEFFLTDGDGYSHCFGVATRP
jgi:uncharacterized glyoxalase superfamily protein PhnB